MNGHILDVTLEELSKLLHKLAPPVGSALRPGLSDEQIDSKLLGSGLTLPQEARSWWRWRGSDHDPLIFETWRFISLDDALRSREWCIDFAAREADPDAPPIWSDAWLPFLTTGGSPMIVIACDESPSSAPVYKHDWADAQVKGKEPLFASVTELVETWLWGLRSGGVTFEGGGWEITSPEFSAKWITY